MTLIALTECCRRLGIDGKTLRRWLAQAQLPVEAHPSDARCKGLSADHLLVLASTHHRRLAGLPQEWPAPAAPPPTSPELLPELLTAFQMLSTLPAQIAALQQQLADLTALVQQQPPRVSLTTSLAKHKAVRVASTTPSRVSARSRPAASSRAKPPEPPAQVLPLIAYGVQGNYVVLCPTHGLLALEPDTPKWFAWLSTLSSFRFVGHLGRLTAHREVERLSKAAWRAHRSIHGHTYNVRLGSTESLTIAALEQAAATLDAHLPDGLPRPFSLGYARALTRKSSCFNPGRAPQAI
jgi:hypothetical protein